MNKHLLTYLFISLLLLLSSQPCHAAVMDNVTETLENVNGYLEEGKTYQEGYMTVAKEYMSGKIGALGDIQGAAKKAEKVKKAAKWAKKQADRGKKLAEKAKKKVAAAKKFADDRKKDLEKAKKFVDDRKKDIADAKQFVDDRKKEIEEGRQMIAEGKQMLDDGKQVLSDVKDTAQAIKETSSSALQAAQAKAGNLQEKAGIKSSASSPQASASAQAAFAASNQAALVAQKADVISELSSQSRGSSEEILLDALPSQQAVSVSADEIIAAAQSFENTPVATTNLMSAEPTQGLSVAEVNQLGTLDVKAKIAAQAPEIADVILSDEQLKEHLDFDEEIAENPNKVKIDPQSAIRLENELRAADERKRATLKEFHSRRKAFGTKADNIKAVGEANE